MTTACAPGKAILFGEHAVVYGRPAIAVPVTQVRACATVKNLPPGEGIVIHAYDLGLSLRLAEPAEPDDLGYPLATTVRRTLDQLGLERPPDAIIGVSSTIPIARGLGSGAAVATALVRALSEHLGHSLTAHQVSDLVYRTEIIHHGTPSGIDNTVIAFEQPMFFVTGQSPVVLNLPQPFWLAIGDTGVSSPTRLAVQAVRYAWERDRACYELLFDQIGSVTHHARQALACGRLAELGELMDENQALLAAIDVSSPELDRLVVAAREAGALGAKLCGAGRGGTMISLVTQTTAAGVVEALQAAGATNTIVTEVRAGGGHADRH